jgi:hypothetical protein
MDVTDWFGLKMQTGELGKNGSDGPHIATTAISRRDVN